MKKLLFSRVGEFGVSVITSKFKKRSNKVKKALFVKIAETYSSADLGGSSKHSNENFED